MSETDLLIVGGGPVGVTLALALSQAGIPSTVLEAREPGAGQQDMRALALSSGTRLILQQLQVWDELETQATAINTIHISQRGSLGRSRLRAEEHGLPALGYVLSYGALMTALDKRLAIQPNINVLYEAEVLAIDPQAEAAEVNYGHAGKQIQQQAKLAVLADGGRSLGDIPGIKRETKHYGHDALVTKVVAELPHDHIAYERFTPMGPVALLPNGEQEFSLVWTGKAEIIAEIMTLPDQDFLQQLHQHFGDRVGRFLQVGKRISFPLKLAYLDPVTAPHLVVIGNAAQTMHPVAGQGFNVGLRDAWELAQMIAGQSLATWGAPEMLRMYQAGRKTDTQRGLKFTDFLVNVFSNDLIGLNAIRGMSLGALDMLRPVKQQLVSKMSYGPRG